MIQVQIELHVSSGFCLCMVGEKPANRQMQKHHGLKGIKDPLSNKTRPKLDPLIILLQTLMNNAA